MINAVLSFMPAGGWIVAGVVVLLFLWLVWFWFWYD